MDALRGAGALDVVILDSSQSVRNPGREDVCTTIMHVPYNSLERISVFLASKDCQAKLQMLVHMEACIWVLVMMARQCSPLLTGHT